MENQTVSEKYVALSVAADGGLSELDAACLVREALRRRGFEPWPSIHIDFFTSGRDTLIIASPPHEGEVSIADYALSFINRYFTN